MSSEDDLKKTQIVEARARNISHNVRCTECGSQSIEESQADVAILLRKLIRDEIRAGKTDKEIYENLQDKFGETVLYAPKFDIQTAALWLSPGFIPKITFRCKTSTFREICDHLVDTFGQKFEEKLKQLHIDQFQLMSSFHKNVSLMHMLLLKWDHQK